MFVAIPMEIAIRELEGHIFLAMHLARRGIPTLLGAKSAVNRICLEGKAPFAVLDKGLTFSNEDHYAAIRRAGGHIIELHAEGMAYLSTKREDWGPLESIEQYVDAFFVWGKKQRQSAQERLPERRHQDVIVTGHPSFDLVRPEFVRYYKNSRITEMHGEDFILFNASAGLDNCATSLEDYAALMPDAPIYSPEKKKLLEKAVAYEREYFSYIVAVVEKICSAFPRRSFIYRPHPTEKIEYISPSFSHLPQVKVLREGAVRPWLASAAIVIHNTCTTGLEALLLGKPVISLVPPKRDFRWTEERALGCRAYSAEELISHIHRIDAGGWTAGEHGVCLEGVDNFLQNVGTVASNTIAEWVSARYAPLVRNGGGWRPEPLSALRHGRRILSKVKQHMLACLPGQRNLRTLIRLAKWKMPPGSVTQSGILDIIHRLREVKKGLPMVRVTQTDLNCVYIDLADGFEKTDAA